MFQAPSKGTAYVAPAEPIDVDKRYIFKLVKLEDQGVSKFADPAKNEDFHNIQWTMHVANAETKEVVFNVDKNPWEHIEFTSSKTGKNPKNGMVAKARVWIEAFLGHSVEDDEITPDLAGMILGRYAVGFFEQVEKTAQTGEPYLKLKIMRLGPYKAGAPAEPKPEPAPLPRPEPKPAATTSDTSLPF